MEEEGDHPWLAPLIYFMFLCLIGGLGFGLARNFPVAAAASDGSLNGADTLSFNSGDLIDNFHSAELPLAEVQSPPDELPQSNVNTDSDLNETITPEVP